LSVPLFSGVRRIGLRVDAQVFQGTLITLLNKGVLTDKMNRFVTGRTTLRDRRPHLRTDARRLKA